MVDSSRSYDETIRTLAEFLSKARPDEDRARLNEALEELVHLQFKHRADRNHGLIVTADEYRAVRNVVWNIDKQIFWNAVAKRLLHLYDPENRQWLIFDDETDQWEGYEAGSLAPTSGSRPADWVPWQRVLNDDQAPDFKWFEGAQTNLSFNALDRYILKDPDPHDYRFWESESWGDEDPEQRLRLNHRQYLFEVTKVVLALRNLGVTPEDRVALLMPEIPEAYHLIEAFHRLGVVFTSLPTSLGDQQVSDRLDNLGVRYVFTVDAGRHKGHQVFYKKTLLDSALDRFAPKEYVRGVLGELQGRLSEGAWSELEKFFGEKFEKKITIGFDDLLAFLDECRVGPDRRDMIARRLAAQPPRVDRVVVFSTATPGDRDDSENERDLAWHDDLFMGADTEQRILAEAAATLGRDLTREDFLDYGALTPREFLKVIHRLAPPAMVEAGHPRLVIYTSGSTGVPKGVVHRTLGHAVFGTYTMLVTMGPRAWDLMDTRATHSWITGLDYIAGMPGLLGVATIIAEGAFDYGRWLKRLNDLEVNIAKAGAPVLRGIGAFSESRTGQGLLADLDFRALRICVNCAEPADPVTQAKVNDLFGRDKYVNTWWPTELSGPNTGAGSATVPFPYMMKGDASTYPLPYVKQEVMADEVDTEDRLTRTGPQADGVLGRYVIDPHPGMLDGIYGDPDKFQESYFQRYWGRTGRQIWYDSGDGAIRHEDGYLHVVGRIGYAFNWNGHISGAEDLEGTLRDHPAVQTTRPVVKIPPKILFENPTSTTLNGTRLRGLFLARLRASALTLFL